MKITPVKYEKVLKKLGRKQDEHFEGYENAHKDSDREYHEEMHGHYGNVKNYVENRMKKYGAGHDMSVHGEGKPHGSK